MDESPALSVEAETIRRRARDRFSGFIEKKVNPGALDRDRASEPIPDRLLLESAELGLLGFELPKEIGGGGEDVFAWGVLLEELGSLCEDYSFVTLLSTRAALARSIFELGGESIERYARPMARGLRRGCFCYTDGGDVFSLTTRAVRVGDQLEIAGEKSMVTGALTADTFMTYVRDERDDVLVVMVEQGDPGLSVEPVQVMGCNAAGMGRVRYDHVRVPWSRVVQRDGVSHGQKFLNRRILLACPALGAARAIFRECIAILERTVRYGQALSTLNNVLGALGRMHVDLESSADVILASLDRMRRSESRGAFDPNTAVAKHFVTERALGVVRSAMQLLGAYAYRRDNRVERHARDFASLIAGGGTQDIIELSLGAWAVATNARRGQ
jgi:alkylation response protein AidB-like acyl-CoA dehydrogenase